MNTQISTEQRVNVSVFARTDVGKVRTKNEDAFVVADLMVPSPIHEMPLPVTLEVGPRGILLAVSDGMGGAKAGEVASALTLHALRKGLSTVSANSAEEALKASVEAANAKVFDVAVDSGRQGMGATITAMLVHGNRAYVAEVGDSRAYVLRAGRLVQLTRDQSAVQALLDNGALTHEQAENFQYRNLILQAMGTKPTISVALTRFELRRGDRVLLCSDGLTGKVPDAELQAILEANRSIDAACAQLVNTANARGGEDNITVVLAELHGEGLQALSGSEQVSVETVQAFSA